MCVPPAKHITILLYSVPVFLVLRGKQYANEDPSSAFLLLVSDVYLFVSRTAQQWLNIDMKITERYLTSQLCASTGAFKPNKVSGFAYDTVIRHIS